MLGMELVYPYSLYGQGKAALTPQLATTTLTASYVNLVVFSLIGKDSALDYTSIFQHLILYITYITGASETATKLDIHPQVGNIGTDLYDVEAQDESSGIVTLNDAVYKITGGTGATTYKKELALSVTNRIVSLQIKEEGVSSNFGTVKIIGFLTK